MVAGHLQEKKGYFYMVLNLKDEAGSRKSKWIPTGLSVKGNKRKAEAMLLTERQKYATACISAKSQMLFADYMLYWLNTIKSNVEESIFAGCSSSVTKRIVPYFRMRDIRLFDLKAIHIQEFYAYCQNDLGISNNTIIHYHANLCSALKYAVNMDLLPINPMDRVNRPKIVPYSPQFYYLEETEKLIAAVNGDSVEFPILMASFYGLRRSEIVGLRWQAVDFDHNRITINHTVVQTKIDGKNAIVAKDRAKNKSNCRSLPLVPQYKDLLLQIKSHQDECKSICGNSYYQSDYIYVNDIGQPYSPNYITQRFAHLLAKKGLRKIRFHELRHPYVKPTTKKFLSFFKFEMAISLRAFLYFALLLGTKEGPQFVPFIR